MRRNGGWTPEDSITFRLPPEFFGGLVLTCQKPRRDTLLTAASRPREEGKEAFMELSVVIPVQNELGNIEPLIAETVAQFDGRCRYEIVVVDDASRDGTFERLQTLQAQTPTLRILRLAAPSGQSCAVWTGVRAARAPVVATLDGDGQNDPADLPRLLDVLRVESRRSRVALVMGRRRRRLDTGWRRLSSKVANAIRGWMLSDRTPDSGCGIKVFLRETFRELPHFNHMHRFLPALFRRQGAEVVSIEVNHRPRERGRSHYGTLDRLAAGIADLAGMLWLIRRARLPQVEEMGQAAGSGDERDVVPYPAPVSAPRPSLVAEARRFAA